MSHKEHPKYSVRLIHTVAMEPDAEFEGRKSFYFDADFYYRPLLTSPLYAGMSKFEVAEGDTPGIEASWYDFDLESYVVQTVSHVVPTEDFKPHIAHLKKLGWKEAPFQHEMHLKE